MATASWFSNHFWEKGNGTSIYPFLFLATPIPSLCITVTAVCLSCPCFMHFRRKSSALVRPVFWWLHAFYHVSSFEPSPRVWTNSHQQLSSIFIAAPESLALCCQGTVIRQFMAAEQMSSLLRIIDHIHSINAWGDISLNINYQAHMFR